jgi:hypothetical protein
VTLGEEDSPTVGKLLGEVHGLYKVGLPGQEDSSAGHQKSQEGIAAR